MNESVSGERENGLAQDEKSSSRTSRRLRRHSSMPITTKPHEKNHKWEEGKPLLGRRISCALPGSVDELFSPPPPETQFAIFFPP